MTHRHPPHPLATGAVSPGMRLDGVTASTVTVVAAQAYGNGALRLTYRTDSGHLAEQILGADAVANLREATAVTWSFDAAGSDFVLAAEAMRMRLAGLFDPMLAVTTSNVEPLPHQLRAVYEEMLPKPGPLRFLLADDPGAGKTIMAGLYLKELLLRGDVARCLIVAPGGLVDQWQEELSEKFDLDFVVLTRELAESRPDGDPFPANPFLIARMDQLSRDEIWLEHLERSSWDLIVVDEAHRMSASYSGQELRSTRRYQLGERLGDVTRHLLLMTATPHAGKDENFQAFLALLDPDRFEGHYRPGVHRADYSGLMRRMVKEDLLTFDGRALFPERIAQTVPYELTAAERSLYEEVTTYVREQMNLADRVAADGDTARRTTVGFALTVLQRRLASSPEAIHRSLQRRTDRLRLRRAELTSTGSPLEARMTGSTPVVATADVEAALEDAEELDGNVVEQLEDEVLDAATAARTLGELDIEIAVLEQLTRQSYEVLGSGTDRKWTELRELVLEARRTGRDGEPAKLIVFTEHRDTLRYLTARIATLLGDDSAVVAIDGGTRRADRLAVRERFTHDPTCWVLVATDAAGEGLNLQAAHLMVNYDLPWNPNRIEQRFGRIHRIGQREVCRLWNLVAAGTREGQVFERLLEKIDEQRRAYGGRVFDVLGEHAFGERPLRDLLIEAIRYGDDPNVRDRLNQVVDASVSQGLSELVRERSLATGEISTDDLFRLRRDLEEARARRLQPYYVGRFFLQALRAAGGSVNRREHGRFEVTHVPPGLRSPRVVSRYARICFDPSLTDVPGQASAELLAPGHPLFSAVVRATLDRTGPALTRGAILLDPDPASTARLLVGISEEITDGEGGALSQRFTFVSMDEDGATTAGPAPHLDLIPVDDGTALDGHAFSRSRLAARVEELLASPLVSSGIDARAAAWSVEQGLPAHRAEVAHRVSQQVERTRSLVEHRLNAQINHWQSEALRLAEEQARGRRVRLSPATAQQRAGDLELRMERRLVRLTEQARVEVRPPRVVGAAIVLPLHDVADETEGSLPADTGPSDRRAMAAVLAAEERLDRRAEAMPHNNPGYDVLSTRTDGSTLRIEVKGRVRGAPDFHVSTNQVLMGLNGGDDFVLAMVEVAPGEDAAADVVRYVYRPFDHLAFDRSEESGKSLLWAPMWARGSEPR